MKKERKTVSVVVKEFKSANVTLPKGVYLVVENGEVITTYDNSIKRCFNTEVIQQRISSALLPFASFEGELPEDLTVKMLESTHNAVTWQFCASVYTEIKVEDALQGIAIMTDIFKE